MLDHSLRHFKRELNNAMDNVLDFRRICKKYFLTRAPGDMDSDEEMLLAYDDGGIDGGPTGSRAHRRSKQANEGMAVMGFGQWASIWIDIQYEVVDTHHGMHGYECDA